MIVRRALVAVLIVGGLVFSALPAEAKTSVPHICSDLSYLGDVIGRIADGGTSTDGRTGGALIVAGDRLEKHASQSKDKKAARQVFALVAAVRAYSDAFQHSRVTVALITAMQKATNKIPQNTC